MRILMTGSSVAQANMIKKRPIVKLDVPADIHRRLTALGHEVDWRPAEIGEDLAPAYDLLFAFPAPPGSSQAPYGLCTTWALWAAYRDHVPTVFFFDDWKIRNVFNDYRSLAKLRDAPQKAMKTMGGAYIYRGDLERAVTLAPCLSETCRMIESKDRDYFGSVVPVIPKYSGWGDKSLVEAITTFPVMEFDPSQTVFDVVDASTSIEVWPRSRKWFLASLSDQTHWLGKLKLTWPVDMVGSIKLKNPRLKTEHDVFKEYGDRWGALAPPYYHDGSGWFRSRYVYSAYAGNVLLCGKGDGAQLSPEFVFNPHDVEGFDDARLQALARAQRDVLRDKIRPPGDLPTDQLAAILKEAEARA